MISSKLKSLARDIEQPIGQLKEIRRSLRSFPRMGIDWPKYRNRFEKAHPEFRKNLISRSSERLDNEVVMDAKEHTDVKEFIDAKELTDAEISIAMLLRLELEIPEIAKILHLSVRAVHRLRRELRKKLGIPRGHSEQRLLKEL